MSIAQELKEFVQLDTEIKRLRKETRRLNQLKCACEQNICAYITANNLPGIKYKDMIFYADQRTYRAPLKKEDKQKRLESALRKYGMTGSTQQAIDDVTEAMKGPTRPRTRVRAEKRRK